MWSAILWTATGIGLFVLFVFAIMVMVAGGSIVHDLWRTRNLRDESKRNRARDMDLYIKE